MPTLMPRAQLSEAARARAALPPRKVLDRRKAFSWPGTFERWSKAYVDKHFWKVRNIFQSKEDALQECALIFARCLNYYADRVDNPAWLMSLYKIAVVNDWNTFARKDTEMRSVVNYQTSADEDVENGAPVISVMQEGPALVGLATASTHLRAALTLLATAPTEVLTDIFQRDDAASINAKLRQFIGVKRPIDLLGELRRVMAA